VQVSSSLVVKAAGPRRDSGIIKRLLRGTTLDKHSSAAHMHSLISVAKIMLSTTTDVSKEEKQRMLECVQQAERKLDQFWFASSPK
jgi:hypothetical protein